MPIIDKHTNIKSPHIVIVGGGLVGASLALILSRLSAEKNTTLSITLIEKFSLAAKKNTTSRDFDARATALSAGSVEIFESMGVWQPLRAHAEAISNIHISDRGHFTNTLLDANDYDISALGYVLENQHLGQFLLSELQQQACVNILAPAVVQQCQPKKHGVTLVVEQSVDGLQQTQALDADVVLVADGAGSHLRESLGIAVETSDYQQSAIIANVALDKPHAGIAYERFTEQGPLALLPLADCDGYHRASVVWTRHSDQVDDLMSHSDDEFVAQLQACFGYRAGRIIQAGKRQCYPLQLVQASEQIRSGIALVGNAAHFLHPVAGQGFNLSLRDCAALANVLVDAASHQQALGDYNTLLKYQQLREQDQKITVGLTDTMVKLFSTQALPLAILRQLGLMSLNTFPMAKKPLAQKLMGR